MKKYNFVYTEKIEFGADYDEVQTEFDGFQSDYDNILFMWRGVAQTNSSYKFGETNTSDGLELTLVYEGEGLTIIKVLLWETD